MAKLPPPRPLREHRPGIWLKESWLRFSGLTLQTRMTVIRVDDGLLLHSPSPASLDSETREELEALGMPRYLVAPNEIHNVGLRAFQQAYPEAHTTGCPGHPQRVKGVRFDLLLDPSIRSHDVPWARSGELSLHVIGGNRLLHEIAIYHHPTKTLVLTDAVEFIDPKEHLAGPAPSRILRSIMQSMGFGFSAPCMSPEHHSFCRQPEALRASLEHLESWDSDSVILAHGRLLEGQEARSAVREAFTATIRAAEKRSAPVRLLWGLLSKAQGGA